MTITGATELRTGYPQSRTKYVLGAKSSAVQLAIVITRKGKKASVLDVTKMRLAQIADVIKTNGWSALVRDTVYFGRIAIFVEKDLAEIRERAEPLASSGLTMVEIDQDMLRLGGHPKTGQSGSPQNRPVVDRHPGQEFMFYLAGCLAGKSCF